MQMFSHDGFSSEEQTGAKRLPPYRKFQPTKTRPRNNFFAHSRENSAHKYRANSLDCIYNRPYQPHAVTARKPAASWAAAKPEREAHIRYKGLLNRQDNDS